MATVINIGAWILCAVLAAVIVKDVVKVEKGGYDSEKDGE